MKYIFGSVTRISNLASIDFAVEPRPRSEWSTGDYVVCEATHVRGPERGVELANGRMMDVVEGDLIVGALGDRAATLALVGSWRDVGEDLGIDMLTAAGLFGRITSKSSFVNWPMRVAYLGHVRVGGRKARMRDYVSPVPLRELDAPLVLVIGTSMSSGKTTSCRVLVAELKRRGLTVTGVKLTGVGRYRDVLSMSDAGADHVFDFVDAGLPSTVCPAEEYREAITGLLSRMAATKPDVMVVEAGASPLERYNGATAVEMIAPWVRFTVLCASDPYAVAGVMNAFSRRPDLVAGGAANTRAGIALVHKLTGLTPLDLTDLDSLPHLRALLDARLGLPSHAA